MINTILRALLKVIFFVLKWLANLILLPLTAILDLLPNFNNFILGVIKFLDDTLIHAIAFGKEVFLNLTGFPQEIITISVVLTSGLLSIIVVRRMLTFIINVYRLYKGSH